MKGARKAKRYTNFENKTLKDNNLAWKKNRQKYLGPSKETQVKISTIKFSIPTYWLWFLQKNFHGSFIVY